MKKRKIRALLHEGRPAEWPKHSDGAWLAEAHRLPQDAIVSVVCELSDTDYQTMVQSLSQARREAHQKEYSWTLLNKAMFVIKASVKFIQCLLNQSNIKPVKFQWSS